MIVILSPQKFFQMILNVVQVTNVKQYIQIKMFYVVMILNVVLKILVSLGSVVYLVYLLGYKKADMIEEVKKSDIPDELAIELVDIEFWSSYGFYFAKKIRAGVALEQFRTGQDPKGQEKAVSFLEEALIVWIQMVELAEKHNVSTMPYQFDPEFSWRKHIVDAEHDILIAKGNIISNEKIDL